MSAAEPRAARDAYLAALPPDQELAVRRAAEANGLAEDDYTWVVLDAQRRASEAVAASVTAAAERIEAATRRTESTFLVDPISQAARVADATAEALANHPPITAAIENALDRLKGDAMVQIADAIRRRAAAPVRSLLFSFVLGASVGALTLYGTYHAAYDHGQMVGYQMGWHDRGVGLHHR